MLKLPSQVLSLECNPVIISHKGKLEVVTSPSLAPFLNLTGVIKFSVAARGFLLAATNWT